MGTVENKKLFIVRIFKKTYTMSVTPFSKRISMLTMLTMLLVLTALLTTPCASAQQRLGSTQQKGSILMEPYLNYGIIPVITRSTWESLSGDIFDLADSGVMFTFASSAREAPYLHLSLLLAPATLADRNIRNDTSFESFAGEFDTVSPPEGCGKLVAEAIWRTFGQRKIAALTGRRIHTDRTHPEYIASILSVLLVFEPDGTFADAAYCFPDAPEFSTMPLGDWGILSAQLKAVLKDVSVAPSRGKRQGCTITFRPENWIELLGSHLTELDTDLLPVAMMLKKEEVFPPFVDRKYGRDSEDSRDGDGYADVYFGLMPIVASVLERNEPETEVEVGTANLYRMHVRRNTGAAGEPALITLTNFRALKAVPSAEDWDGMPQVQDSKTSGALEEMIFRALGKEALCTLLKAYTPPFEATALPETVHYTLEVLITAEPDGTIANVQFRFHDLSAYTTLSLHRWKFLEELIHSQMRFAEIQPGEDAAPRRFVYRMGLPKVACILAGHRAELSYEDLPPLLRRDLGFFSPTPFPSAWTFPVGDIDMYGFRVPSVIDDEESWQWKLNAFKLRLNLLKRGNILEKEATNLKRR